jgi:hypothetical protein
MTVYNYDSLINHFYKFAFSVIGYILLGKRLCKAVDMSFIARGITLENMQNITIFVGNDVQQICTTN